MADTVTKDEVVQQPETSTAADPVVDNAPVKEEDTKPEDSKQAEDNEASAKTDDAGKGEDVKSEEKHSDVLKTTAAINKMDHSANRKFDPSVLPVTDDPEKIRAQVEFYFGDSNLPQDKYLWGLTGGPENNPVKIKKICSFSRMRRFQPYEAVVKALRQSPVLNVEGPEGDEEITRKKPYESSKNRKNEGASIYAKGFGDEEPSTQFDIEAFFTKFGTVNSVRLRRTPENLFKGSVFVEFQTEDQAKAFLALDPKPQWNGHDLKIMSKKDYVDEKNQLIQEGKMQPSAARPPRFWEGKETGADNGRGRGRGRGGRDFKSNIDRDDWKKRRDEDQKNGFRDKHSRFQRGRSGRDRGGRGGRGGRDDRRDRRERSGNDVKPPAIQATNENGEVVDEKKDAVATNGKRARADDEGGEEPPSKKVDSKAEVATEAA